MMVDNVEHTVAFYERVLGFEAQHRVPGTGDLVWALVQRGDVQLLFQARACLVAALPILGEPLKRGAVRLFLPVEGVEALYEHVRRHADVVSTLRDTAHGTREFTLRDPNGFVVTLAERVVTGRKAA